MSPRNLLARVDTLLLIGMGGFAGSILRYATSLSFPGMPGTLLVNALGSLGLGFVLYGTMYSDMLTTETRMMISVGLLSSFTTYSTFALESTRSQPPWLVANIVMNYGLGFAGILLGRALSRHLYSGWSR
ncbi:MAG: CrcB family protein [Halobacteriaceae archaeon]